MAMLNNQRVNWSGSPPVDSVDGAAKDRTLLASLLDQWDLRRRIGPRLFRNSLKNPSFLRYSSNGSAVQNVQNTPSKSSKSSKIHVFDLFLQLGTSSEADFTWEFGGYAPSPVIEGWATIAAGHGSRLDCCDPQDPPIVVDRVTKVLLLVLLPVGCPFKLTKKHVCYPKNGQKPKKWILG